MQHIVFAAAAAVWPGAVGDARRLGRLLLRGLEQKQISARSERFRGRVEGPGPKAVLLTPDWRRLGVWALGIDFKSFFFFFFFFFFFSSPFF